MCPPGVHLGPLCAHYCIQKQILPRRRRGLSAPVAVCARVGFPGCGASARNLKEFAFSHSYSVHRKTSLEISVHGAPSFSG